jgi:hypothetical protein
MAKRPKPPPDDPEESARFIETAKVLEADKGKGEFGRAFKAVTPPAHRRPKKPAD